MRFKFPQLIGFLWVAFTTVASAVFAAPAPSAPAITSLSDLRSQLYAHLAEPRTLAGSFAGVAPDINTWRDLVAPAA